MWTNLDEVGCGAAVRPPTQPLRDDRRERISENLNKLQMLAEDDIISVASTELEELAVKIEREVILKRHNHRIWQTQSGKWETYVDDESDGKTKRKQRNTRNELLDYLIIFYNEIDKEERIRAASNAATFKSVYERWIENKRSNERIREQSLTRYRSDYNRFIKDTDFEATPITCITKRQINEYINDVIQKFDLTGKALSGLLIIMREVFLYALDDYDLKFDSEQYLKSKKWVKRCKKKSGTKDAFSLEEAKIILDVCQTKNDVVSLGISLVFWTGMRVGELTALRWEDVDFENRVIRIRATAVVYRQDDHYVHEVQDCAKTDAGQRNIALTDEALEIFQRLFEMTGQHEFVSSHTEKGYRIQSSTYQKRIDSICTTYGIRRLGMHGIRRTFATLMKKGETPDSVLQKTMGHRDINTTMKCYVNDQTSVDEIREYMERALCYG